MFLSNPLFLEALENKDEEALVNMAQKQAAAGVNGIDLNLGSSEGFGFYFQAYPETNGCHQEAVG